MIRPIRSSTNSESSTKPGSPTNPERSADPARRLSRLVGLARAADLWERLWRGLVPPLAVVGLFLCVSWLGLWLMLPHWGRGLGVALFALLLAASCFGLWRVVPLSRQQALRRIDRASGLGHRPASVLEDQLATRDRDPMTDALWALHQRRAHAETARLKAGAPSPRVVELDRYALRFGVVVALFACAIVAGPQRYALVAAAFDFGGSGMAQADYRVDAWIDPPAYTNKPPVLLDMATDKARNPGHPETVAVPIGSVVVVRSSGALRADVETSGPLLPPPAKSEAGKTGATGAPATADSVAASKAAGSAHEASSEAAGQETRLVLHGDSQITVRRGGSLLGTYRLTAIPDQPPTIVLRDIPKVNARGTFKLTYATGDDYGVASAEARFSDPRINGVAMPGPSLVDPPKAPLSLQGAAHGIGDNETTLDLSENPWAGAEVTMTLVARDEAGNEGRSDPVSFTIPQKPFANPLARALVEQRRKLVLDPTHRADVGEALAALMIEPEAFGTSSGVYLGLRFASDTLARAQTKAELVDVADYLWGMALQIENGDLSQAEKDLRAAEKELRDAIDRRASPEEIQKLTQNLQAAMDKFLKELAQKEKGEQQAENGRPSKTISQSDLQKLIERLKEKAKSGNREEAKKALDELQDLLENLKTAKRQKQDPQASAMAKGLNQLDQMMRDQQDLRDETFKKGQGEQGQNQQRDADQESDPESANPGADMPMRRPGRGGSQSRGQRGQQQGQSGQGESGQGEQGQQSEGQSATGKQGRNGGKSLGERQQDLQNRLADIQKRLKQAGAGQGALDDAQRAMSEAEDALRDGQGANGQAVDAQGRALDALRKGAKKLADAMQQQQGEGQGGQANSQQDGSQGSQEGQQSSDADPLGRPRGGNPQLDSASRFDPLGVPAAQRAQHVLEELRRRLADPFRNQEEIDYLERLLQSY